MVIVKNKNNSNLFDMTGVTEGKLMAIASALQKQKDSGTITVVGSDVLQSILVTLNMNKMDDKISKALG